MTFRPIRRESRGALPDLFDWLEAPLFAFRPSGQGFRVEEMVQDGRYVIRAELPGIDPEADAEVSVTNGVLTIRAERKDEHKDRHRSEFHYGSLTRSLVLPSGADEEDVQAQYDKGILTVTFGMPEQEETSRTIPIRHE